MNTLDIIFLVIGGASVIYSLIRGLTRVIFSFLSVILGFFGASYGYSGIADWLKGWVHQETVAQILADQLGRKLDQQATETPTRSYSPRTYSRA